MGVFEQIVFAGSTDEPEKYYGAADLLVHPTFYDACSLTVLEALASGLPVITTSSNGASGMLINNESGFVIEDPRNIKTLSERIAFYFNKGKRQEASIHGRRYMEQFSSNINYREMMDVFLRVVHPEKISNER